eukprot:gene15858-biopygen14291
MCQSSTASNPRLSSGPVRRISSGSGQPCPRPARPHRPGGMYGGKNAPSLAHERGPTGHGSNGMGRPPGGRGTTSQAKVRTGPSETLGLFHSGPAGRSILRRYPPTGEGTAAKSRCAPMRIRRIDASIPATALAIRVVVCHCRWLDALNAGQPLPRHARVAHVHLLFWADGRPARAGGRPAASQRLSQADWGRHTTMRRWPLSVSGDPDRLNTHTRALAFGTVTHSQPLRPPAEGGCQRTKGNRNDHRRICSPKVDGLARARAAHDISTHTFHESVCEPTASVQIPWSDLSLSLVIRAAGSSSSEDCQESARADVLLPGVRSAAPLPPRMRPSEFPLTYRIPEPVLSPSWWYPARSCARARNNSSRALSCAPCPSYPTLHFSIFLSLLPCSSDTQTGISLTRVAFPFAADGRYPHRERRSRTMGAPVDHAATGANPPKPQSVDTALWRPRAFVDVNALFWSGAHPKSLASSKFSLDLVRRQPRVFRMQRERDMPVPSPRHARATPKPGNAYSAVSPRVAGTAAVAGAGKTQSGETCKIAGKWSGQIKSGQSESENSERPH